MLSTQTCPQKATWPPCSSSHPAGSSGRDTTGWEGDHVTVLHEDPDLLVFLVPDI